MQSKDEFMSAFTRKPVEVEADGKKVHVLPLSPADIRAFNEQPEGAKRAAFALVRSVCDPSGNRLLSDEDAAGLETAIAHAANEELLGEIARVNRLGEHAKKAPSPTTS